MNRFLYVIALLCCLLRSCTLNTDPDAIVSSLRFEPSAFDSFTGNTQIRYTLAIPARVNVYVTTRDSLGRLVLVRTIVRDLSETKGSHNHTWLGDTEKGIFASAGLYTGILQVQDASFETSVRIFHF